MTLKAHYPMSEAHPVLARGYAQRHPPPPDLICGCSRHSLVAYERVDMVGLPVSRVCSFWLAHFATGLRAIVAVLAFP